ncbi:hypothetical protein JXO59_07190 [candidate division KSB1 bacterium]|nr:hypothetical protein [candidate division KSB1 bacterium]
MRSVFIELLLPAVRQSVQVAKINLAIIHFSDDHPVEKFLAYNLLTLYQFDNAIVLDHVL